MPRWLTARCVKALLTDKSDGCDTPVFNKGDEILMFPFSSISVLVYASAIMALLLDVYPLGLIGVRRLVFMIGLPCVFIVNFIAIITLDLGAV